MNVIELPVGQLVEAPWNPNSMDGAMAGRLRRSIEKFGLVENLVVRRLIDGQYEVIGGNHRLWLLRQMGFSNAPCVVLELDDAEARLLAQALNRIEGVDDLGLRAELVRSTLESIPRSEVLAILPETAESLDALTSLDEADLATSLRSWEMARKARLHHFTAQISKEQLSVVEQAMARVVADVGADGSNPTRRGNALYALCRFYLERSDPQ